MYVCMSQVRVKGRDDTFVEHWVSRGGELRQVESSIVLWIIKYNEYSQ